MTRIFYRPIVFTLLVSQLFFISGCKHVPIIPAHLSSLKAPIAMLKKDIDLIFVQENHRLPAHILYKRQDRYAFLRAQTDSPFRLEMVINPLMRNPSVVARVEKNGKAVREFVGKKTATSVLSENKTSWTPTRSKLALIVPYVAENEVVVVTTTYEWMDVRWMPPILMQEDDMPTVESKLTVDVPYGVTMHFKAAKDRTRLEYVPTSFPQEKSIWMQDDNRAGLGMRYVWSAGADAMSEGVFRANLLQVMLSFDSPTQNDAGQRFDSWATVASYLYNRIDRYDMPSSEIRGFAARETKNATTDQEKIDLILTFLKKDIQKRVAVGSFNEQDLQPATRTFARRFGTPSDIAILGKSLLISVGIDADVIAAADARFNPDISDFYSPSLFSSIILAINNGGKTIYFDPEATDVPHDQLSPNRQGQQALLLRPKNGVNFSLPYDSASKNLRTYSYQLWMSEDGVIEGEYSIDLIGFEAQSLNRNSGEKLRAQSIPDLEKQLYGSPLIDFSLESAEIAHESAEHGIRVSGFIKPVLLLKNAQGGFELKLDKLIAPVLQALKDAQYKGYSSTTKISLFIGLPNQFVVENLPSSQNVSIGGVDGRFFAETSEGQLVVEGIAMISLPIRKGLQEKIDLELKNFVGFGNHSILIHEGELFQGGQDGDQKPKHEENS